MKYSLIGYAALLCLLGGCAAMNKKECQAANWYALGLNDGNTGAPMSRFTERSEACAGHGIAVNHAEYLRGRQSGLKTYCTPQKGYDAGTKGYRYHGVCEGKKAADFLAAYQKGSRIYAQQRVVSQLDSDISRLRREITRKVDEKSAIESDLIGAQTPETRAQLVIKLNRVTQRISDARAKMVYLYERRRDEKAVLDNIPRGW